MKRRRNKKRLTQDLQVLGTTAFANKDSTTVGVALQRCIFIIIIPLELLPFKSLVYRFLHGIYNYCAQFPLKKDQYSQLK